MAGRFGTKLLNGLLGHTEGSTAILDPTRGATYGTLLTRSAEIARRLLDGRRSLAGARVALLLPPGPAFVETLLAILRAGGVAVPLSSLHTPPELEHILVTAQPDATVVDPGLTSKLNEWITTRGAALMGSRIEASEAGDVQPSSTTEPLRALTDDSAALMLFTSGTTGKPKGVNLSHAGVAATLDCLHQAWRWSTNDRLLHTLPLYHTHGLIVALLGALWAGAAVRFMPFDAANVWDAFGHATVFMAVPTMYVRLCDAFATAAPDRQLAWAKNARGLRLATSGSAALPAALLTRFAEATGQTVLERYGMTEIGMALANPYDGPRVPGAVGVPLPGVSIDIVDDRDQPVPDGQAGELRVRSPQLFLGYHGDPDGTTASYDAAGRFRTGDTAMRDPGGGHIRLLGRTSVDILKSGGYKLSALEIEDALRGHPAVADIAVIGVPDPVWGDCVTACVVPRPGTAPTIDDLRAFARDTLAPYKLPRALRLLASLPRNPMGKVQKSLLK